MAMPETIDKWINKNLHVEWIRFRISLNRWWWAWRILKGLQIFAGVVITALAALTVKDNAETTRRVIIVVSSIVTLSGAFISEFKLLEILQLQDWGVEQTGLLLARARTEMKPSLTDDELDKLKLKLKEEFAKVQKGYRREFRRIYNQRDIRASSQPG